MSDELLPVNRNGEKKQQMTVLKIILIRPVQAYAYEHRTVRDNFFFLEIKIEEERKTRIFSRFVVFDYSIVNVGSRL